MDEQTFLGQYADGRLQEWWHSAQPFLRAEMVALVTGLHATPLAQLDQFTVGLHTGQPDGWDGARLVFAIRNNTVPNGHATTGTFCLSVPLNARPRIAVTVRRELGSDQETRDDRQALGARDFLNGLHQRQAAIRQIVDHA